MRLFTGSLLVVAAGSIALLLHAGEVGSKPKIPDQKAGPVVPAGAFDPDKNLPQDNNYIVHEWGTFTSFSGSDGIALDFKPLVGEDLPKFVLDRAHQAALSDRRKSASDALLFTKVSTVSKRRMETPVTYFYTDQERIVDVKVDFPSGLLTEFYPPVRQFGPDYKKDVPEPLSKSWLRWGKVRLIPEDLVYDKDGVDPYIPQISQGENEHYAYARETDSAHIQITDPLLRTTYREKFLFYRGLGNFELPVSVKSTGTDHFTLTNTGAALHYAFVVQVDGKALRFARYDNIAGGMEMILPKETATLDALSDEVAKALMSDGLYRKEAYAMVKTWKSSWFGEQGTRVFYSLPQSNTDALLPLHLTPAPKELVRVMIGRLETLTPEQEQKIQGLVSHLGDVDPAVRDQTSAQIKAMGRFAEPALTHVAQISGDPEVQLRAQALLKQILMPQGIKK